MFFNNKQEKTYDEIIDEIRSNMSENKESNLKYLKEQAKKYKTHKMGTEIIKEIGRMIFNNMPESKKEELSNIVEKDFVGHYDKGCEYINKNDLESAKNELIQFLKPSKYMFKEDMVSKFFSPTNSLEFVYLCHDNKEKQVRDVAIPFSSGYRLLGSIYIDEKKLEDARECFDNSLKWNPYNVDARFEKAETYKMVNKLDEFKNVTEEAHKYIYLPKDLARYYRNLGYYYIEKENYKLALALELYSIQIDDKRGNTATSEIMYIIEKSGNKELPDMDEILQTFKYYNIPIFFDPQLMGIAIGLKNDMKNKGHEDSPLGKFVSGITDYYMKFLGE